MEDNRKGIMQEGAELADSELESVSGGAYYDLDGNSTITLRDPIPYFVRHNVLTCGEGIFAPRGFLDPGTELLINEYDTRKPVEFNTQHFVKALFGSREIYVELNDIGAYV